MTDETWKLIGVLGALFVAAVGGISGLIKWHFSALGKFKDEIHNLEIRLGKLETKDELQQTAISELPKLIPELHSMVKQIGKEKRK